jgi:hypothetical protein
MRAGIVVNVTLADRHRLEPIVLHRSAPQKHVLARESDPCYRRQLCDPQTIKGAPWLARQIRWTFYFTRPSASWPSAVEGHFAKLTHQRLKRGVFRTGH